MDINEKSVDLVAYLDHLARTAKAADPLLAKGYTVNQLCSDPFVSKMLSDTAKLWRQTEECNARIAHYTRRIERPIDRFDGDVSPSIERAVDRSTWMIVGAWIALLIVMLVQWYPG